MKIKTKGAKEKYPFFSIIVPTYNRPRQIVLCLQSLSRINYPHPRFEVIVVDDGSRPPVQTHISPFFDKMNLTVLTQENAGPSMARNVGAKSAKGDFLAFTDDDCMPASDWLQTLLLRFKVSPGCAIVGRSVNVLKDSVYDTASQMLIEYLHAYYNQDPDQANTHYPDSRPDSEWYWPPESRRHRDHTCPSMRPWPCHSCTSW